MTKATTSAPGMPSSCPDVGPGLHLDQRAERQLGHADGRAGRAVVAEAARCRPRSSRRSRCHVAEEDGGLHDVGRATRPRTRAAPRGWRWPGAARPRAAARPACRRPSPTWPDTTSQSPARTIGVYGPTGFAMRVSLASRQRVPVGQSGGQPGVAATRRRPPRRTPRRTRCTGGPVAGDDLDLDRRHVDGPQHAERADREVVASPSSSTAMPSDATQPAPCARRRCSTSAARPRRAGRRTSTRTRTTPSAPISASATAPACGSTHRRRAAPRAPASSTAASAQPAARSVDRRRRAGARRPPRPRGRARRTRSASAMPGVRTTRSTPRAVGLRAAGDRRALRAERARRPRGRAARAPAGRARRPARGPRPATGLSSLPPNAPPLASGRRRLAAGLAPRRVGLEVGGLDPRVRRVAAQSPAGSVERRPRRRRWSAGPAPCRPRRGPRPASRRPPSRRAPSGTATSASAGAVSSANPPPPSATRAPTRCGRPALDASARARGRRRGRGAASGGSRRSRRGVPGVEDRAPAGAAAQVGEQRLLDRGVRRRRALGPQALEAARRCPGVQKPHWLAPVAQNASAQRVAHVVGRGRRPS